MFHNFVYYIIISEIIYYSWWLLYCVQPKYKDISNTRIMEIKLGTHFRVMEIIIGRKQYFMY